MTVEPGATIPDPVKLLDYVLAVSWSENKAKPTDSTIGVTISTSPQFDVQAVATKAGFTGFSKNLTQESTGTPSMPKTDTPGTESPAAPTEDSGLRPFGTFLTRDMTAKFGAWPGAVPDAPTGLVQTNGADG